MDDFEDALDKTGFGKFNLAIILLCGLSLFTVNMDVYSTSYILPAAQCDMELSTKDKGLLTTMNFLGFISSSHIWGFISDTRGRKNILVVSLIISFTCTLVSTMSTHFFTFAFFRFWSGFFMAAPSIITYAYLGEFHSAKRRTKITASTGIFVSLAIVVLPALAWVIIPQTWNWNIFNIIDYKPWRLFILLCSSPSVLVALALLPFPESPKFLLERGKKLEALAVLGKIYALNTGKPPKNFPIKELKETITNTEKPKPSFFQSMYIQTAGIFRKPYLVNSLTVCALQFGLFAVSSGLLLWYPDIINQVSEYSRGNSTNAITVCEAIKLTAKTNSSDAISACTEELDNSVFKQNIIIGVAYIVGFSVVTLIINNVGKRTLLVVGLLVSGGSGVALCWVTSGIYIDFLFVGLLVLSGICVCIVTAAVVDMFPTSLRAMAVSMSLMLGRVGSVAASSTIGLLLELNCMGTFLALAALLFGCALMSFMIPNRISSERRSTEKIQI